MGHKPNKSSWRALFATRAFFSIGLMFATLLLISTVGCYEKNLAPVIKYSPEDVEVLREEIEKMDWE